MMNAPNQDDNQTASGPSHHNNEAAFPAAAYLNYKARTDGWSTERQAAFLGHLADNGVVGDAAQIVGKHVSGGYALRRQARGYAFGLGWDAALLIARRVVADAVMTAAIKGETARWVRDDGITVYTRQNTKLSLSLLDRMDPANALPEVMAVVTQFDIFLQLIEAGATGEMLWSHFFDAALPFTEHHARARVKASLLLSENSLGFGEEEEDDEDDSEDVPIEYKSMAGAPQKLGDIESREDAKARRNAACAKYIYPSQSENLPRICGHRLVLPNTQVSGIFGRLERCRLERSAKNLNHRHPELVSG
jgi:hypothetical protein